MHKRLSLQVRRVLKTTLLWTFATVTLLPAGCANGALGRLRAKAALDFKCDRASIRADDMPGPEPYYARAIGCGTQNWYVYDGAQWVSPADRAAFELSCPIEQLTSTAIDRTTIGVSGCDKTAVYVLVQVPFGSKWVLNSTNQTINAKQ